MGSKESLKAPYHITYCGFQDSMFGVHIATRPPIPSPKEVLTTYHIPGRDGVLTIKDGTIEDVTIPVEFSFTAYPDDWQGVAAAVRNWLLMSSGTLELSDIPDAFYKVRYVELGDFEREYKKTGTFTANFICEGCQYLNEGQYEHHPRSGSLTNPGITSHPQYMISGAAGTCILTVNGRSLTATVSGNMTIDTERAMAYRTTDGVSVNTALIMGDYDFKDFWLKPGENTVSATAGFDLKVVPNWRRL